MALLSLRDEAARGDWLDTRMYVDSREALADVSEELRAKFGDDVYDRYLYAFGKANRVLIKDVYPNSAAEAVSIQPGDVLQKYASESIFTMSDMRQATARGVEGESVRIEFQRDGVDMYETVPRGPLGVKMEAIWQAPGNFPD